MISDQNIIAIGNAIVAWNDRGVLVSVAAKTDKPVPAMYENEQICHDFYNEIKLGATRQELHDKYLIRYAREYTGCTDAVAKVEIKIVEALSYAWSSKALQLGVDAHRHRENRFPNEPICVDYYNDIAAGKPASSIGDAYLCRFVKENINNDDLIDRYYI